MRARRLLRAFLPLFAVAVAAGLVACEDGSALEDAKRAPKPSDSLFVPFDGGVEDLAACATSQATATLKPVNLVFVYDKSGSMGSQSRRYDCSGREVACERFAVNGGSYAYQSYVCYPAGASDELRWDEIGNVTLGGAPCAAGAFGNDPVAVCNDMSACTLTSYFDPAAKWIPVNQAVSAFFRDAASATMSASLSFFPRGEATSTLCGVGDYTSPDVPLRALPDSAAFDQAVAATKPAGETPTDVALTGAIAYARGIAGQRPNDTTAVVLVTDGDPTDCGASPASLQPISTVASIVRAAAEDRSWPIKTHVIGVGESLTNLSEIASAGGTGRATLVSTTNAAQTSAELRQALEAVRGKLLSCDVPLPSAPGGKELDRQKVNVVASIQGKDAVLTYSENCSAPVSWRYDDPSKPSRVVLCDDACRAIRAADAGRLSVAFGCATKIR
jgi:hypothetical protein